MAAHPVGAHPGAHQHVGGGLGRRVGARRVVGRRLGEPLLGVQLEVAVDLVGRYVMQPHPVGAHRFQNGEGAHDVGVQKRLGIGERIVDVGFGGEMHHRISLGDQPRHQLRIGHIALHQADVVLHRRQRLATTCIGQAIQHRHRMVGHRPVHEIGADKPRATGHQQPHPQTTAILLFDFNLKRLADGLADGGWTTRANSPAAAPAPPDQYHKDPCPHEIRQPCEGVSESPPSSTIARAR